MRKLSTLEEVGNAITHGAGFIFAVIAFLLMIVKVTTSIEYLSVFIYSFGLMVLFIMSCLYHSFKHDSRVKRLFQRFDHSSIYLLIGGTYTPILLLYLGGVSGWLFFSFIWVSIVIGVILKATNPQKYMVVHLFIYVIMGWSGIVFIPKMLGDNIELFWFILTGGIAYTGGVWFYIQKFPSSHFVWHFFVIFGAVLQFIGIYGFLL